MERREKIELAVKERERTRLDNIQKKWTRREENEFLRVLTGYGVDLQPHSPSPTPDWTRFKAMSKLDKKSDEALSDYYKVFIAMCKRQAGVRLNEEEKGLDGLIEDISEDHARLVLDRLELLSKLKEVAKNPAIDERMSLCQNNFDTPDWWEPGKHDKELVKAVLKHGLYNSGEIIYNNPEYSFFKAMRAHATALEEKYLSAKIAEAAALEKEVKDIPILKKERCDSVETAPVASEGSITSINTPPADAVANKDPTDVENFIAPSDVPASATDVVTIDAVENVIKEEPKAQEKSDVKIKSEPEVENAPGEKKHDPVEEPAAEKPDENESVAQLSLKAEPQIDGRVEAMDEDKPTEAVADESSEKENSTALAVAAETEPMEIDESKSQSDEASYSTDVVADQTEKTSEDHIATETDAADKEKESEESKEDEPVVLEPKVSDEVAAEPDQLTETNGMEVDKEESEDIAPSAVELQEARSSEEAKTAEVKENEEVKSDTVENETAEAEMTDPSESIDIAESSEKHANDEKVETGAINVTESAKTNDSEENAEVTEYAEKTEKTINVDETTVADKPEAESEQPPSSPVKMVEEEPAVKLEETPEKEHVPTPTPVASGIAKRLQEEDDDVMIVGKGDPDDDDVMNEKEIAVEEECKKQAAELKARFPDLEVIQPLVKSKVSDSIALAEMREKFMAMYESPMQVYWFRDFALEKRINHIIYCIEHVEWPVNKSFSAYTGCQGMNLDIPLYETVKHMGSPMGAFGRRSTTPDVITITTDQNLAKQLQNQLPSATTLSQIPVLTSTGKKRKRHIAIDVETERAKLHALLNSSQGPMTSTASQPPTTPQQQKQSNWSEEELVQETTSRRSNTQSSLQPPPAHQHHTMSRSSNNQQQASNYSTKPTVIPGTTSTLTPIDLSSR